MTAACSATTPSPRDAARRDAWRVRRRKHPPTHQAPPPPPPPHAAPRRVITVVRNRNSRASFCQLDGVDDGEDTNRPLKPSYPEGTRNHYYHVGCICVLVSFLLSFEIHNLNKKKHASICVECLTQQCHVPAFFLLPC